MKYYTRQEAQKMTGKAKATVIKYCIEHDVPKWGNQYQLTLKQIDEIKALADSGKYIRTQRIKNLMSESQKARRKREKSQ